MKFNYLSLLLLLLSVKAVQSQTLPVGLLENTDDNFRRQQLLGKDSSNSSFMIRPLFLNNKNDLGLSQDIDGKRLKDWNKLLWQNSKGNSEIRLLPLVWQQQINSHHPYGMNDGAMIPAKGYQTLISGGIYAKIGPLSIQLRPEYVYAENKDFTQTYQIDNGSDFKVRYSRYYNTIDAPERFGSNGYSKFNLGQSSIRLNFDPISIGISNENLWWGPGIRSSLLMSNNASGFKHLTLNTLKPIQTYVGAFEAQIVAGRLESSGVALPSDSLFRAKKDDWRYFSGIVMTYQPKWIPGLYLGFDRSYIIYHNDLGKGFFDYLPIFSAVEKSSYNYDIDTGYDQEDAKRRDQRISFFARWLLQESKAEFYFQYGKNDHNYNLRDAWVEPEHSRAYVAGFRKLMALNRSEEYIQIGIEVTQLESPGSKTVRPSGYWYNHSQVRHGYTNQGQVLGAGIGSGSNLQSLDVSWVKGLKRIGFQLERTVNNNDLMYAAFGAVKDHRRHWVDLGLTGKFDWDYKGFILNTQLAYIRSINYQYAFKDQDAFFWKWNKQDVNNIHLKVGIMYRL